MHVHKNTLKFLRNKNIALTACVTHGKKRGGKKRIRDIWTMLKWLDIYVIGILKRDVRAIGQK